MLQAIGCTLEPRGRSHGDEMEPEIEVDAAYSVDASSVGPGFDAGQAGADASVVPIAELDAAGDDAAPSSPGSDATLPGSEGGAEAGSDHPDAEAGVLEDAHVQPDAGSCSIEGAFGVELLYDVTWRGTNLAGIVPLLTAGRGQIRIIARLDMRAGTAGSRALVAACGATLPDFAAGNSLFGTEQYAGRIPNEGWDQPTMPRWDLGWELGCNAPGCSIASELLVATIGARASSGDVWPGRTGPISNIVPMDHDGDGAPAITFRNGDASERSASGAPYAEIPVSWTLAVRATRVFIPYQLAGEFHGQLDSCDAFSGVVTSGRVEARSIGCYAHNEGQSREFECSAAQAQFLDENLPNWTVTGGTWRARRIPATANCAAVRAAWD
jgi:hypothetical protein